MSKCFGCKHFKQTSRLDFTISGYCDWAPSQPLPHWLSSYANMQDSYYGPKKETGLGAYAVKDCDAFEPAEESVVEKRFSEEWYA